jgi:uncharacterized protein YjlB
MAGVNGKIEPLTIVFQDDGLVPNNSLAFLLYEQAVDVVKAEPERALEELFRRNRWGGLWRNGIYDYLHYHSTAHEVLGIAQGHARVRFGGDRGREFDVSAGDVAILPAGTGHQCMSASPDFSVVGGYPPGQTMEITRPSPDNHAKALETIPQVPLPPTDPVMGEHGPLLRLWTRA